jgi:hypothetical protein
MEQASLAINGSPATYCSTRSLCRCGTRLSSASTVLPPPLSACGTHCGLAPGLSGWLEYTAITPGRIEMSWQVPVIP